MTTQKETVRWTHTDLSLQTLDFGKSFKKIGQVKVALWRHCTEQLSQIMHSNFRESGPTIASRLPELMLRTWHFSPPELHLSVQFNSVDIRRYAMHAPQFDIYSCTSDAYMHANVSLPHVGMSTGVMEEIRAHKIF